MKKFKRGFLVISSALLLIAAISCGQADSGVAQKRAMTASNNSKVPTPAAPAPMASMLTVSDASCVRSSSEVDWSTPSGSPSDYKIMLCYKGQALCNPYVIVKCYQRDYCQVYDATARMMDSNAIIWESWVGIVQNSSGGLDLSFGDNRASSFAPGDFVPVVFPVVGGIVGQPSASGACAE